MARIRSVKPSFFTSEDVSTLPLRARLTWIGLWTHCDDHGRAKELVKLIKAAVWPLDDVSLRDVEDDLGVLHDTGMIVRYTVEGARFLAVQNWHFHQKVNRPGASACPDPPVPIGVPIPGQPGHCDSCWIAHDSLSESSVMGHGRLTPGGDRKGEGGEGNARGAHPPPGRPRCRDHTHLPDDIAGPACVACRDVRLAAEQPRLVLAPPWCGECSDEQRRQVELDDGRLARCPRCHPLRSAS